MEETNLPHLRNVYWRKKIMKTKFYNSRTKCTTKMVRLNRWARDLILHGNSQPPPFKK